MAKLTVVFGTVMSLLIVASPAALSQAVQEVAGGGGVNLAVYEAGNPDGQPIVFLHGFTATHLSWAEQLSGPLAEEFRLIAFDLRGHGASGKPLRPEEYTDPALWAEDIDAVIRSKELEDPILVGWSYGGYAIADYLRRYGDDAIGGLVFVGALTKLEREDGRPFLEDGVLEMIGAMVSPELPTAIGATRSFVRLWTAQPMDGAVFETFLGGSMMVPHEVRLALVGRGVDNDDVLAGIGVPTLVLHGDEDLVVRIGSSEHIVETVPGAMLRVYEGIGHTPQLENPEAFDRDLAGFAGSLPRNR